MKENEDGRNQSWQQAARHILKMEAQRSGSDSDRSQLIRACELFRVTNAGQCWDLDDRLSPKETGGLELPTVAISGLLPPSCSPHLGGSIIGRSRRIRQLKRKQEPTSVSNIVAAAYTAVCACPPSAMLEGQTDPSTHNTPWMLRRYVCPHHPHNP